MLLYGTYNVNDCYSKYPIKIWIKTLFLDTLPNCFACAVTYKQLGEQIFSMFSRQLLDEPWSKDGHILPLSLVVRERWRLHSCDQYCFIYIANVSGVRVPSSSHLSHVSFMQTNPQKPRIRSIAIETPFPQLFAIRCWYSLVCPWVRSVSVCRTVAPLRHGSIEEQRRASCRQRHNHEQFVTRGIEDKCFKIEDQQVIRLNELKNCAYP